MKVLYRCLGEGSLTGDTEIPFSDHEVLPSEPGRERCV
jgi:hypothetical protein